MHATKCSKMDQGITTDETPMQPLKLIVPYTLSDKILTAFFCFSNEKILRYSTCISFMSSKPVIKIRNCKWHPIIKVLTMKKLIEICGIDYLQ